MGWWEPVLDLIRGVSSVPAGVMHLVAHGGAHAGVKLARVAFVAHQDPSQAGDTFKFGLLWAHAPNNAVSNPKPNKQPNHTGILPNKTQQRYATHHRSLGVL
jgi:hypothetical protein